MLAEELKVQGAAEGAQWSNWVVSDYLELLDCHYSCYKPFLKTKVHCIVLMSVTAEMILCNCIMSS